MPVVEREGAQMTGPRVEVVCRRCGGYGVTLYPCLNPEGDDPGVKVECADCGGTGCLVQELWDGWKPDPLVLEMLATYRDARS
jgi:hypothetical protein